MNAKSSGSTRFVPAIAAVTLLVLTLLYWKYRIIDTALVGAMTFTSGDLYNQYYPMVSYGFSSLRAGRLPLWDPFQLCGVPFLAVPYVGLFYPVNFIHLFVEVSTGIELVFIFHMFFAAVGMWCLQRHFGISSLGGLCSALTFAWSGWLVFNAHQIPLYAGMAWMPVTVLLFDRASSGRRRALFGLIAAVTLQLLLGATETLVHNLHVGAFFACARLVSIARQDGWGTSFRRGALLVCCVAASAFLAAFQLLPTLELTSLSNRAAGALTYAEAVAVSRPVWWVLFHSIGGPAHVPLGFVPSPVTGVLPFLAIFLAFGNRTSRRVWLGALIVSVVALLLVSGDPFYRLYYALPWGAIFRRPEKLLSVYQFGQALLAGVAISQLQSWSALPRSELWTRPAWLAAFSLAALLCGFGVGATLVDQYAQASYASRLAEFNLTLQMSVLVAILLLLVTYGCATSSRSRIAAVVCILVVQGANLFFATSSRSERPVRQETFEESRSAKNYLRKLPGYFRTYLFKRPSGFPEVGFREKDGTMNGIQFVTAYESLILGRYGTFFERLVAPTPMPIFVGFYPLLRESRWPMMNLTSTAYYVASHKNPANSFLRAEPTMAPLWRGGPPPFYEIYADDVLAVHETPDVLPRAYLVPEARVIEDPDRLLDSLVDLTFDPRKEVLLEEKPFEQPASGEHSGTIGSVKMVQYQPEQVTLEVTSKHPGYLVLTDAFYPGWTALVNGQEAKIYRANYLFRAVQLPAGSSTVRFAYRPASFRLGLLLSALCAVALMIFFGRGVRSQRLRWARESAR